MELKFRKVHIDSRFRATGDNSDFQYELAEPFDCPDGTICYMDNAVIPMSWDSVGEHNKFLYLAERDRRVLPYVYYVRRIEIAKKFYSGNPQESYRRSTQSEHPCGEWNHKQLRGSLR